MKKFGILLFTTVCGVSSSLADVTGVVRGSDSRPLQGASVVLLSLPDSTYVNGAMSDEYGHFCVTGEKNPQPYLLSVQAFGHEPKHVTLEGTPGEPLEITLALATTELEEVTVRGKAPSTTREGGKFIFIPNDLANDVANANNLLKHVPLVSWGEGRAYITGKGLSKVYLNGRDPHWDTNEIQAMLRTLDPHLIKRVEVITDPGATQAAAFSGGVINIIYDDPSQGWRGNLYTYAQVQSSSPMVFPNLWLNYQKGKFKSSINLKYYYGHNITKENRTYDFLNENRKVVNELDNSSYSHSLAGRLNLSYDLTERSVLGAGIEMSGSYSHATNNVKTLTTEADTETSSLMKQTNETPMKSPGFLGMLYYTLHTDRKGSMFDIIAAYGTNKVENNFHNDFSGTESVQALDKNVYVFSGKAVYRHVFGRGTDVSAGLDFSDSHNEQNQTLDGDFRCFKYYDRQIHGYLQFSRVWSQSFSSEIGLRLENTHTYGHQIVEDLKNRQDYTDLFPSVNLSWNLHGFVKSISLSYTRGIIRPAMYALDPYKIWTSDNSYSQGNPDLKPSYSDRVSLYSMLLQGLIFNASYTYNYRLMVPFTMNTTEGYSLTSVTNSGRSHLVSMNLTYNKGLFSWWRTSASASARYRNFKTAALNQELHTCGWDYSFSWDNSFFISRKHQFSASLNQEVSSPANQGTLKTGWQYKILFGLSKSFNMFDISLNANIPAVGFRTYEKFMTPDYAYEYHTPLARAG